MKAILFLGTSLVGAQYISAAVLALGYRPIFLLNIDEYSGDPKRAIERCEYYKADVNSLDDILRAIQEHEFMNDVDAVTSLLDETLQNACAVAKKFGILGPDLALNQLTDKTVVREMIPKFSPPSFIFKLSDFLEEDLRKFFNKYNIFNEFILKPGISSGAVGVSMLGSTTTGDQIKNLICESVIEDAQHQNWIIQPRIVGRLHSLEGFVRNGQVFFLGFSRRVRKELTESINEFPVDKELPRHLQQQCQEAVKALVQHSGYKNGYFHCEFIINSETVYFIDGNMGRVAGAAIVQQFALVYGKSPVDIYKHVFDLGIFNEVHTQDFQYNRVSEEPTVSIHYCIPEAAVVLDITAPMHITSFHTQIAGNGRKISAVGASDSAWVGFLAGFKETVLREIQQIVINTDKGSVAPFFTFLEQQAVKKCQLNNATEGSH